MKRPFLEAVQERVILGDGAMGTYLFEKGVEVGANIDLLNLTDPDLIISVHEDYVRAGSDLIETNTFGANRLKLPLRDGRSQVREVNLAGAALAARAAGKEILVAGSVGPTGLDFPLEPGGMDASAVEEVFYEQISALVEGGVDLVILETFTHPDELVLAVSAARRCSVEMPIVAQMVFPSQGRTSMGMDALSCAERAIAAGASVFGTNCGRGVKAMLDAMKRLSVLRDRIPLSAFPNAGLPEILGHRTVYSAQPLYMARGLAEMIKLGARLVGGCCGTTPEHIRVFREHLHLKKGRTVVPASLVEVSAESHPEPEKTSGRGALLDKLDGSRIPILVELDPPPHLDFTAVLTGARKLSEAGVDAITLADHPLAVLRADNLSLAHRIRFETGVSTVLHLTCRDRNVLALQSQIMAAHTLGIDAILAVTGDPAASSDQPGARGVFDIDSLGLIRTIQLYNSGMNLAGRPMKGQTSISIGCAFSYRPANPEIQIRRLERKIELGARFVMTQPLFTSGDVEAMMNTLHHFDHILVFPGIFPLISARNAEFLHNEIPGIVIPASIREAIGRFEKVEDQRALGLDLARRLIEEIASWTDGLYIVSPLNKWEIPHILVREVRNAGWKGSRKTYQREAHP